MTAQPVSASQAFSWSNAIASPCSGRTRPRLGPERGVGQMEDQHHSWPGRFATPPGWAAARSATHAHRLRAHRRGLTVGGSGALAPGWSSSGSGSWRCRGQHRQGFRGLGDDADRLGAAHPDRIRITLQAEQVGQPVDGGQEPHRIPRHGPGQDQRSTHPRNRWPTHPAPAWPGSPAPRPGPGRRPAPPPRSTGRTGPRAASAAAPTRSHPAPRTPRPTTAGSTPRSCGPARPAPARRWAAPTAAAAPPQIQRVRDQDLRRSGRQLHQGRQLVDTELIDRRRTRPAEQSRLRQQRGRLQLHRIPHMRVGPGRRQFDLPAFLGHQSLVILLNSRGEPARRPRREQLRLTNHRLEHTYDSTV